MKVTIIWFDELHDVSFEKAVKAAINSNIDIQCTNPTQDDIKKLNNKYKHNKLPPVLHIEKESKNKDRFGKFIKRKFK